jgi:hypothetical protein
VREKSMTWTLKIMHLDVAGSGDATLIIAKNDGKDQSGKKISQPVSRSVLIDGGKVTKSNLQQALGQDLETLDVMICTHYDKDHVFGLTNLLKNANKYRTDKTFKIEFNPLSNSDPMFRKTVVFDQGVIDNSCDNLLINFSGAVGDRLRPTANVDRLQDGKGNLPAYWLVGKEVMWYGGVTPPGAPELTCVAANAYVIQKDKTDQSGKTEKVAPQKLGGSMVKPEPNEWSLAFLLKFGNFKYYVGGDLTSIQESGCEWNGKAYVDKVDKASSYPPLSLMQYLGPVDAMKTSHHGSRESSSSSFIDRLVPRAAFISCGTNNEFGHPHQQVIDALDSCSGTQAYFLTGFYTPGYESKKASFVMPELGKKALVAGVWASTGSQYTCIRDGDIVLSIDEREANQCVRFKVGYCTRAALLPTKSKTTDTMTLPAQDSESPQMTADKKNCQWRELLFS